MSSNSSRTAAWARKLAIWQATHPLWAALLVLLLTIPAAIAARSLDLKTSLSELLPQNKKSVMEMRRVSKHLASSSTLTIVIEGRNSSELKRIVDEAAPKLRALGPEWVGGVDDGVRDMQRFLRENRLLYAPLDDLKKLHDEVQERYDYEVGKATGLGDLGLDDDDSTEAGQPNDSHDGSQTDRGLRVDRLQKVIDEAEKKTGKNLSKYPDGYYLGEDGHLIVMMVRTPISGGDLVRSKQLLERVGKVIASVHPNEIDPSIVVRYTGDFITSAEEYRTVKNDLAHVGLWGLLMILTVVLLFFLRIRSLIAIGITIGVGLAWTFGATRFAVGYLNSSTGFLVSIIAGNGINVSIIYMARYLEARREQRLSVKEAIERTHLETWRATLTASAAAMVAYGSLAVTNFKGFKHFGIIGGMGMMLCWAATYATLPTVLVLSERMAPMFTDPSALRSRARGVYGYVFAWLGERFAVPILVTAGVLGIVSAYLTVRYVTVDPMEYSLRNLSNDEGDKTTAKRLSIRVDRIVGRMGQDGMAMLTDRLDQVIPLKHALLRRRDAAPPDKKPFEKVVTIFDLLPSHQKEKIKLANEIIDLLKRAHDKGFVDDEAWKKISEYIPDGPLKPIGIGDLPSALTRSFTEKDGTVGRIVYIVPTEGESIWDGHYLDRWADSFREVRLPNGEVIYGSGRAVMYSDILRAVREDAPKAILASFLGTVLVIFLSFRFRKESFIVLGTVLLGFVWLGAYLYLSETKLNFLNFVAVPITFGVGADYAVNMMRRSMLVQSDEIKKVVVETGGAVVLCSLTTTLGYSALMLSRNRAIRGFGAIAAVGEVTTLLAAVLVFPALLVWLHRRSEGDERGT